MTVSDLIRYFGDGDMFPDPKQEVKFKFCPDGATPFVALDIRSTTVPEEGEAVVDLEPAPKGYKRKFTFSLKFEANPVVEAVNFEEAAKKASEMMRGVKVVKEHPAGVYEDLPEYKARVPHLLAEEDELSAEERALAERGMNVNTVRNQPQVLVQSR